MKIDLSKFDKYLEDKTVSVHHHPTEDLHIYNYTQVCQFSGAWDEVTMMSRGLILDSQGNVIARPFKKFFNREERPDDVPNTSFIAYDKADGSLGIRYKTSGGYALATRGSFTSDQAIEGTKMLQELEYDFKDNLTYLFEIIYPENRIVIDYGKDRKLIFLGAIDIETGEVLTPDKFPDYPYEKVSPISDFESPRDNAEGVVLYFKNGFMCKVKYEEYIRLHRLVTGVTARRIWDILRNKQDKELAELTERVPEEFKSWVEETTADLNNKYKAIEKISLSVFDEVKFMETRKEQAGHIIFTAKEHAGIVFAMLDNKPYDLIIWKQLKPAAERPFREDL